MTQLPAPPNRQPIMASRMVNAYKAYAQSPALAGARRPGPATASYPRPQPVGDPPPAPSPEQAAALNTAHGVLASMQEMIRTLQQRGEQDTPEFKELFDHYRRLSTAIKQSS